MKKPLDLTLNGPVNWDYGLYIYIYIISIQQLNILFGITLRSVVVLGSTLNLTPYSMGHKRGLFRLDIQYFTYLRETCSDNLSIQRQKI